MSGEPSRKRSRTKNTARRTRDPSHARQPSQGAFLIDGVKCFRNSRSLSLWPNFKNRKIELGRNIAAPLYAGYGISHRFGVLGWKAMIELDFPCYPDMVRAFYCNLEVSGIGPDLRLTSLVAGHDISFGIADLAELLELPNEGDLRYMAPRDDIIFSDEEIASMHIPMMPKFANTWKITEQQLKSVPRLISRVVQHNVYPRGGEREKQRLFQTFLTYCIYTNHPGVNLPYVIMMHMAHHVSGQGTQVLPYGILLTRVFEHFGVRLDIEGPLRKPAEDKAYKPITHLTLKQMGLPLAINEAEDEIEESDAPAVPPPAEPAAPAPTIESLAAQVSEFMTTVNRAQRLQLRELRYVKKQLSAIMQQSNIPPVSQSEDDDDQASEASSESDS